ncbi:porin family protein [Ferruginibacter albus]|uniref:porin family protein n=1 Tax=Ferruginibacter albus TaxID=2875540 RepID=UPI001CC4D653|nr:porin family protein [Ferruginibacter albus]UAY52279.1 PorT family protein [Ferruginibacter albus]
MKKLTATLFAIAFICSISFAQNKISNQSSQTISDKGTWELTPNIGFNFASLQANSYQQTASKVGLNIGASIEYYISDRWSFKGRLAFDQKGWGNGFIVPDNGPSYTTDFTLNYVTTTLLASYHFAKKRNWYLHFGPYFANLISASESAGGMDVKDAFSSGDIGLDAGIGVRLPISEKAKIIIEYDGQSGFGNVFKSGTNATTLRGSFNFGVNLKFN